MPSSAWHTESCSPPKAVSVALCTGLWPNVFELAKSDDYCLKLHPLGPILLCIMLKSTSAAMENGISQGEINTLIFN